MSEEKPEHQCASSNARYRTNVIPDDAYSPTIEIGNDGSLTLVVGGTGMTRPVTEWFKAMVVQSETIPRAWWERLRAKIETEYFRDAAIWSESQAARIALCLKLLALMDRIEKEGKGDE